MCVGAKVGGSDGWGVWATNSANEKPDTPPDVGTEAVDSAVAITPPVAVAACCRRVVKPPETTDDETADCVA